MNNKRNSCLFLRYAIPMMMLILVISLFVLPPVSAANVNASVNVNTTYQTLEGFGAAISWYQEWLTEHPNKMEVYDLLFNGLGLDIYRFRNQYRNTPNFDQATTEILQMASASLGHPIKTLLSSWSPPADLKKDGVLNGGTLAKESGAFVYNKFADYWYNSLIAYGAKGINPTYISIQNEPDFENSGWETCILRPVEDYYYPAYGKALDAVYNRLQTMAAPPKIIGPESAGIGSNTVQNYANNMNLDQVYGINYHLYNGGDPMNPDTFIPAMEGLAGAIPSKPFFQTEYDQGTPFTTALLIYNSLVYQRASAYFFWDLIWTPAQRPLIGLEDPSAPGSWTTSKGYIVSDWYYVFKQFTKYTDPGFKRVFATTDLSDVKITGFISPDQNQLTLILINNGAEESTVTLNLGGFPVGSSAVYRTIPGGVEKFAAVGSLGPGNTVTLPAKSIATAVIYSPSYQPAPTPAPLPTQIPPPATRSAFGRIEAESFNTFSGIQTALIDDAGGRCVGYIENGDYIGFNNVDFNGGAFSFQARITSGTLGGNIEIRIDSPNGAVMGTCPVASTGSWDTWATASCNLGGITGTHNLYLVFTGSSGYLFNFDYFQFNTGTVVTPTPTPSPIPSPTTTPTPTPTSRNILYNPGFELGDTSGWYSFGAGAVAATSDQVQEGAFSALVSGRTDTWQGIAQDVTSKVTVGTTYEVTGWVRLKNQASDTVSLSIKRTDADGDYYENVVSGTATNTGWIRLSGSYTVPANTGLVLYAQGPAAGVDFYLDNVTMTPPSGPPPIQNLLTNPGFEQGNTTGWYSFGAGAIAAVNEQFQEGSFSALVSGRTDTWQGIAQDVTAKATVGVTYQISAWIRLKNQASDTVSLSIKRTDTDGDHYENVASGTATNTGWIKLSGSYTVPANSGLVLYAQGPAAGVDFYLDNVTMTPPSGPPPIQNLLTNPGLETGDTSGWYSFGAGAIAAVNEQVQEGSFSALVSGRTDTWQGIAQDVTAKVTVGQTYEVSAWVRLKNQASDTVNLTFKRTDTDGDHYENVASGTATNTGWIKLSGSYTVPANSGLVLYAQGPAAGVDFYLDNASMLGQVVTVGASKIKVQMMNGNLTSNTMAIQPWFKIKNTGTFPVKLQDIKIRYYYTIDGEKPQNFWCDWSTVGGANVTGNFVKMNAVTPNANYYLEIGFQSAAGSLAPGQEIDVNTRFAKSDWSNYDQVNDYSFNSAQDFTDWNQTPAYVSDVMRWGMEPSLLVNPGFEAGTTTGWYNFGGSTIAAATDQAQTGDYCALVTGRTQTWEGIAQNLMNIMKDGRQYEISGWFKLKNVSSDTCRISIKKSDDGGDSYNWVASQACSDSDWTKLSGSFVFQINGTLTNLELYTEGQAVGTEFYYDNISVREVYVPVTGITLDQTQADIYRGDTVQLTSNVTPGIATYQNVTWSSSNPAIATVDQNGLVTGLALGAVNISATAVDGNLFATCLVEVVDRAPELADLENPTVKEGQALTFVVTATDPDGDPLTYSATNLPAGASFDPLTQVFTWTPDYSQAGGYMVHFEVNDGVLNDSLDLVITVTNISPEELTLLLLQKVGVMGLDKGIKNSLLVKLQGVLKWIQWDCEYLAMGWLKAFEWEVNALTGKKVTSTQAEELKQLAETIYSHLKEAVATEAPGKPILVSSRHTRDGNYYVIMRLLFGNNGTSFKLYENGVLIYSQSLADHSPNPQAVMVPIKKRPTGTYQYYCELTNANGTSTSNTITVNVKRK